MFKDKFYVYTQQKAQMILISSTSFEYVIFRCKLQYKREKMLFCAKLGMEIKLQILFSGLWMHWAKSVISVWGKNDCVNTSHRKFKQSIRVFVLWNGVWAVVHIKLCYVSEKEILIAQQQQTGQVGSWRLSLLVPKWSHY